MTMLADQLGHFKHVDHRFAAENFFQSRVGNNVALVLRVLQVGLLDVSPEFFDHLGARHRTLSHTTAKSSLICIGFINAEFTFFAGMFFKLAV